MFSEFRDEVIKIKDTSSESVVTAVQEILNNPKLKERLVSKSKEFIETNLYEEKSLETLEIYSSQSI
jgi:hypothetical protein